MHTLSHTHTARVHKETSEGNGYVYYLDCGENIMYMYIHPNPSN